MLQGSLSGFILVGGKSVRMGTNKALLPFRGRPLVQHIAHELALVANPVCLVGPPASYEYLNLPVIPDLLPDRGPLSGIEAALLSEHSSDWNLIVACDMPRVTAELFLILAAQITNDADCIVPQSISGKLQPLCALYRKRCGPRITQALTAGTRRVVDMVAMLQAKFWHSQDPDSFQNVNTAPEWDRFLNDR